MVPPSGGPRSCHIDTNFAYTLHQLLGLTRFAGGPAWGSCHLGTPCSTCCTRHSHTGVSFPTLASSFHRRARDPPSRSLNTPNSGPSMTCSCLGSPRAAGESLESSRTVPRKASGGDLGPPLPASPTLDPLVEDTAPGRLNPSCSARWKCPPNSVPLTAHGPV